MIIDEHVFVRLYTDTKDQTTIWSQDTYLTTTSRSDLYHQLDTHFSKVCSEASGKVGEPIGMAAEEENAYWENIEASQHNPLPSPRIFISYRQDDSKWAASRLYDYLASVFGEASVFLDHTTLLTGSKYREAILGELNQADIILPIIGESWISDRNLKRLHDEQDLVRIEIETALDSSRQKKLFPILVDKTQWPNSADLPESIREVVAHHSQERLNFTSFRQDARAVVAQILRLTQSSDK
ncbi:MAG: toll/interleukin-1 receptor domain-containing protein [Henriciella sp.]